MVKGKKKYNREKAQRNEMKKEDSELFRNFKVKENF